MLRPAPWLFPILWCTFSIPPASCAVMLDFSSLFVI
jgi:hypothetical protein